MQFDLNYTYSKSIDLSSDANRIVAYGGLGGQIINPWRPKGLRALSDFDLTHQINANWIAELPFGKGKWIGRNHTALPRRSLADGSFPVLPAGPAASRSALPTAPSGRPTGSFPDSPRRPGR